MYSKISRSLPLFLMMLLAFSDLASAEEGLFTANKECAANKALRSDNPGDQVTAIGQTYRLLDFNKDPPTHYLIEIPGAPVTQRRWVDIACGTIELASNQAQESAVVNIVPDSIENVLAASWQPTFCASSRGQSKPECQSQTADRPDATQFSIHGLWPDDLDDTRIYPCYCNKGSPTSCKNRLKPVNEIGLSSTLWEQLAVLMPGVQSGLHLHEWTKHGSCYEKFLSGDDQGANPEEYYAETVSLINALNASLVGELFASNLGKIITYEQLQNSFDDAFGHGAGDRVFMNCTRIDGVNFISELWIGLGGGISLKSRLGDLIQKAPPTSSSTTRRSCQRGTVYLVKN